MNNDLLEKVYPVGSIYLSVSSTNPGTLFGGTWESWGSGRVPVGVNTSDSSFNTVEKTGGEKSHRLTVAEMPKHSHQFSLISEAGPPGSGWTWCRPGAGTSYATSEAGSSNSHNNLQPYITCYMWKRIS